MHCPDGNAADLTWRVLAFSDGISSWTPLKPQNSIPCWLSFQWEPSACRSCQCCKKKKGSLKVCWWIELQYFLNVSHFDENKRFIHWLISVLVNTTSSLDTFSIHIINYFCSKIQCSNLKESMNKSFFYHVRQWSGRPGFNPRSSHTKDFKNGTWSRLA